MNQKSVYAPLVYAGVLPFLIVAVAPYFGLRILPIVGELQTAGALYGLVIIGFMAGTHWGVCMCPENALSTRQSMPLMLASNVYAIVPWLIYLAFNAGLLFYLSLIAGFVLILLSDRQLLTIKIISDHYYRTRRLVTLLVVICLVLTWFTYRI